MDVANFNAPSYTDNFGVKLTTATDHFMSTDIVTESKTITYEAEDFDQNTATASVVIEVIGRFAMFGVTNKVQKKQTTKLRLQNFQKLSVQTIL